MERSDPGEDSQNRHLWAHDPIPHSQPDLFIQGQHAPSRWRADSRLSASGQGGAPTTPRGYSLAVLRNSLERLRQESPTSKSRTSHAVQGPCGFRAWAVRESEIGTRRQQRWCCPQSGLRGSVFDAPAPFFSDAPCSSRRDRERGSTSCRLGACPPRSDSVDLCLCCNSIGDASCNPLVVAPLERAARGRPQQHAGAGMLSHPRSRETETVSALVPAQRLHPPAPSQRR